MRYQPVKVHHIISVQYAPKKHGVTAVCPAAAPFAPATSRRHGVTLAATGVVKEFFRVECKLFGECGHNHKTEAAAQPCKRRMEKRWHEFRSKQSKKTQRDYKLRTIAPVTGGAIIETLP